MNRHLIYDQLMTEEKMEIATRVVNEFIKNTMTLNEPTFRRNFYLFWD